MHDRPEAVLDLPATGVREAALLPTPLALQFERVAAALKALGRPFPRALAFATGAELASHVLHEVPGLRLVALEFATMPHTGARRLGPKTGRRTQVTRHASDNDWHSGLGRFDAIIAHDLPPLPAVRHQPAVLLSQIRHLLLPGGALLFSCPDDVRDRHHLSPLFDDPRRALADAGWSSVDRVRSAPGQLLLKAHP